MFKETTVGGTRSAQANVTKSVVIVERMCRRVKTNKLIKLPVLERTERNTLITPNVQNENVVRNAESLNRLGSKIQSFELFFSIQKSSFCSFFTFGTSLIDCHYLSCFSMKND